MTILEVAHTPLCYAEIPDILHSYLRNSPMQTWYLQVQDSEYNVLLHNQEIGNYKKYNKWIEKKIDEIIFRQYPTAKRWEVRTNPYTSRVVM